jgi:CRP-like cAMP-binding protein
LLFLAINLYQIVSLILERRKIRLSAEDQDLYASVFPNLAVGEFRMLLKRGERRDIPTGTVLVEQGHDCAEVMLVEHGAIALERDGRELDRLREGSMLGEIAFVAGRSFSSKATVAAPTRIVAWERAELNRLFLRRPALAIGFHAAFIGQLRREKPSGE